MLNVDMGFYHQFTADANGAVTGKYCSQGSNSQGLKDCSATDSSYMPLSSNAQTAYDYATNQATYFRDVIDAFYRMTSHLSEFDANTVLTDYHPGWVCVNGQPQCYGDIW